MRAAGVPSADLPEALQLASWRSVERDGTRRSGARVLTTPAVRDALPARQALDVSVRRTRGGVVRASMAPGTLRTLHR
jgi:hypothetical protein